MATEKQIEANRLNSQKSTGPKTPEGKAKSRLNHYSHGFAASTTLAPGENYDELGLLLAELTCEYKPMTATEQILIEEMVHNRWLSLRAFRLQGEAFYGQAVKSDSFGVPKDLGLLIRYHSTAERNFHKAHAELVKTQKERKKSEIGFESQNAWQPPEPLPEEPARNARARRNSAKTAPLTPETPDFSTARPSKVAPNLFPFVKKVA